MNIKELARVILMDQDFHRHSSLALAFHQLSTLFTSPYLTTEVKECGQSVHSEREGSDVHLAGDAM